MTSSHVVIGARQWATHYDPMGEGAAGVLYGFVVLPGTVWADARIEVYRVANSVTHDVVADAAELDLVDNPLAYPSRHVVDP